MADGKQLNVLRLWPVSRVVNSVRNNGAELLDWIDDPHASPPSDAPAGANPAWDTCASFVLPFPCGMPAPPFDRVMALAARLATFRAHWIEV